MPAKVLQEDMVALWVTTTGARVNNRGEAERGGNKKAGKRKKGELVRDNNNCDSCVDMASSTITGWNAERAEGDSKVCFGSQGPSTISNNCLIPNLSSETTSSFEKLNLDCKTY